MDSVNDILSDRKLEKNFTDTFFIFCKDTFRAEVFINVSLGVLERLEFINHCVKEKHMYYYTKNGILKRREVYSLIHNKKIEEKDYIDSLSREIQRYPTGELKSVTENKDTLQYYTEWYQNGQMKYKSIGLIDYLEGGKLEEWEWWNNGQLLSHTIGNYGKQPDIAYDSSGTKLIDGYFIDMPGLFKVGTYTEWWPNGQKYVEWHFKDGNTREEANYKIGTWSWWDENGNLIKQEFYKDNKLVDKKEYLPKVKKKEK